MKSIEISTKQRQIEFLEASESESSLRPLSYFPGALYVPARDAAIEAD